MFCSIAYFCAFFNALSSDDESFGKDVSVFAFLPPGPIISVPVCSICGNRFVLALAPNIVTAKYNKEITTLNRKRHKFAKKVLSKSTLELGISFKMAAGNDKCSSGNSLQQTG